MSGLMFLCGVFGRPHFVLFGLLINYVIVSHFFYIFRYLPFLVLFTVLKYERHVEIFKLALGRSTTNPSLDISASSFFVLILDYRPQIINVVQNP